MGCIDTISDEEDYLEGVSKDSKYANPKLGVVKEVVLTAAKRTPDLRCIIFVRTREMTVALAKWMNEDQQLKPLGANRLAGKGPSAEKAGEYLWILLTDKSLCVNQLHVV